jgi:hypothetical protein
MEPVVQWVAPASLWQQYASAESEIVRAGMRRPHILRFATDSFMDEFMTMLQNAPARLHEWRAQPEVWQAPARTPARVEALPPLVRRLQQLQLAAGGPSGSAGGSMTTNGAPPTSVTLPAQNRPLKLYQPGHMRFYLVTACLVCRVPGLPDRLLDFGASERAGFVVRRLRPKPGAAVPNVFDSTTCDEYAFVAGKRWVKTAADALAQDEELNPMFGVTYIERDGRKRRVLAAPISVGKRETYLSASADLILPPDGNTQEPVDPRKAVLLRTVTDPWRSLIEQAKKTANAFVQPPPPGVDNSAISQAERDKVTVAVANQATWLSWLILLDFGAFLEKYLPSIWAVMSGGQSEGTLTGAALTLYTKLNNAVYHDGANSISLVEAVRRVRAFELGLETNSATYPATNAGANLLPNFHFRLDDPALQALVVQPGGSTTPTLDDLVVAALPASAPPDTPPLPLAATLATADLREPEWFLIRCVFERPNCTPLTAPLLSEPTEAFQMAAFFDPQAPARPIRINLPLDTTPAGLRKFDRNTAFMISDALCGQMNRMGDITFGDLVLSVLPWPLHKDLPLAGGEPCAEGSTPFGIVCSLSIPIITICAFILLIIIVGLLDIIFRWIPFFIMCFPLPRFKAKEN